MTDTLRTIDFKKLGTTTTLVGSTSSQYSNDAEDVPPPPPPKWFMKNFLAKGDPEVSRARKIYLKAYISGLGMVIITIFCVFSIYWGSLWKVPEHSLRGIVVDFDGGEIGQSVVQSLINSPPPQVVRWRMRSPRRFPRGPVDVQNSLKENEAWAAIVINDGASANLANALLSPNGSYNGSEAITAYGVEARNENAYRNLIRPLIQTDLDRVKLDFALQLAARVTSSPDSNLTSNLTSLLSTSPQTIINPISYTIVNLIPFNQPVASAVAFVGLIYCLILSFFVVMVAYGARQASGVNRILDLKSLIILRLTTSFLGYFFLSLFYSLLSLAFKLDFTRRYGHSGFFLFWMLNYFGMLSVGLALESLITIFTATWIPYFQMLWIIANVSVCVFPIEILPGIFHYGYATPFYNLSISIRSIAFGTKNTLGPSFGILILWVAISSMTLPFLQWFVRRRQIKAADKQIPEKRIG
ncbi:unnamed protein product [Cyclocybe aegerita]|uniref:DUF3533 domain-containing protein n=1 Tax=Cyclocybe aegerita TaxID=1973307 RepID=A0A8S0VZC5_CYCAE|nr:unnamed protein product [Cyclocybe aegerita]